MLTIIHTRNLITHVCHDYSNYIKPWLLEIPHPLLFGWMLSRNERVFLFYFVLSPLILPDDTYQICVLYQWVTVWPVFIVQVRVFAIKAREAKDQNLFNLQSNMVMSHTGAKSNNTHCSCSIRTNFAKLELPCQKLHVCL